MPNQDWRNDPSFKDGSECYRYDTLTRPASQELLELTDFMYRNRDAYNKDPVMQARMRELIDETIAP